MGERYRTAIFQARDMDDLSRQLNELAAEGLEPCSVSVYDNRHPEAPGWYLVLFAEAIGAPRDE